MRLIIDHAERLAPLAYSQGDPSKAYDSKFVSQPACHLHFGQPRYLGRSSDLRGKVQKRGTDQTDRPPARMQNRPRVHDTSRQCPSAGLVYTDNGLKKAHDVKSTSPLNPLAQRRFDSGHHVPNRNRHFRNETLVVGGGSARRGVCSLVGPHIPQANSKLGRQQRRCHS